MITPPHPYYTKIKTNNLGVVLLKGFSATLFVLLMSIYVNGQTWPYVPAGLSTHIAVIPEPPADGQNRVMLEATVTSYELNTIGLGRIIDGDYYAGYKLFNGDWVYASPPYGFKIPIEYGWPPGLAEEGYGHQEPRPEKYQWHFYYGPNCDSIHLGTSTDTTRVAEGFGYWKVEMHFLGSIAYGYIKS